MIERLPIGYEAPYDCRHDHVNCPWCARSKATGRNEGDHGIFGGSVTLSVRTEVAGLRYAATLTVFDTKYLAATPRPLPESIRKPRGAYLIIHREDSGGEDCDILGDRHKCIRDFSCLLAEKMYADHGVLDSEADIRNQPEALWTALEAWLVYQVHGEAKATA